MERKLAARRKALSKAELAAAVKEDLKTVALGTSKINYMDPRITIAWCKRNEVCGGGSWLFGGWAAAARITGARVEEGVRGPAALAPWGRPWKAALGKRPAPLIPYNPLFPLPPNNPLKGPD